MHQKEMIKIRRDTLVELISNISAKEMDSMMREIKKREKTKKQVLIDTPVLVNPRELNELIGIVNLGGDALEDTEQCYE